MTTEPKLTLTAAFDRALAWEGGGSVRHLVATLAAEPGADTARRERKPLNLALVIDASGSMAGDKLEAAKAAAIGVVTRLGLRDRLSIVSFADDVITHVNAATMDEAGRERAHWEIARLHPRGCTDLAGGWFAGVEAAARVAEENPALAPRVVILSDGHANRGITHPGELAEHAAQLRHRGVITSTLGIGNGYDERLLQAIAEHGGGRMHDAERADEISTVLLGEIGEAEATLVEGVTLEIGLPRGVRAEVLGLGAIMPTDGTLTAHLGALAAEAPRSVIVRLFCPAGARGEALPFRLEARGTSAESGARTSANLLEVALRFVAGAENDGQPRDARIATTVARIWQAHLVRQVASLNRDRDYRGARELLRSELPHFRRYVEGLPGAEGLLRELHILEGQADRPFEERTRKEMMLSSYKTSTMAADLREAPRASWSERLDDEDGRRR